jgi:acetoacetate decarboxylase
MDSYQMVGAPEVRLRHTDRAVETTMRKEDVLKLSSMPAASPSYPDGPYRFVDREYMVISYETDPEVIRAELPEPLEPPEEPVVHYEWIKMPDSSGFGSHSPAWSFPPAFAAESLRRRCISTTIRRSPRAEIWGFPKNTRIKARDREGHLRHAPLHAARRHGHDSQARSMAGGVDDRGTDRTQVNLKLIPGSTASGDLPARAINLSRSRSRVWAAWRLRRPHVNAPVAALPVRRVVGARHFIADLTLPYGRVIYDYRKDA